jgi:hypothetical protein
LILGPQCMICFASFYPRKESFSKSNVDQGIVNIKFFVFS